VENMVLPFQTIEHIDEPRSDHKITDQGSLFDTSGRQIKGWTNKLIWGDNKLILSSLKNGPLRKQIEAEGGLKLIYIDPPFDVGADFSMDIKICGDTVLFATLKKESAIAIRIDEPLISDNLRLLFKFFWNHAAYRSSSEDKPNIPTTSSTVFSD
jgi:hypothetical protein